MPMFLTQSSAIDGAKQFPIAMRPRTLSFDEASELGFSFAEEGSLDSMEVDDDRLYSDPSHSAFSTPKRPAGDGFSPPPLLRRHVVSPNTIEHPTFSIAQNLLLPDRF